MEHPEEKKNAPEETAAPEENGPAPKPSRRPALLPALLIAAGACCLLYAVFALSGRPRPAPAPPAPPAPVSSSLPDPVPSSAPEPAAPVEPDPTAGYPEGKLFITVERSEYESGSMTLSIPKLELYDAPVLGDVEYETLKGGLGLYDYAQMPGTGNRNVSIAGHRDIYGMEFYYIDTLEDGDEMWLDWNGTRYVYRFKDSKVVEADDWSPIYIQGFSCLTLTSCTPIGVASHRIIVRAELADVGELPADPPAVTHAMESSAPSAPADAG